MHFDGVRTKVVIENQICTNVTSELHKVHAELEISPFVYFEGFVFNEALEENSLTYDFCIFLYAIG